MLGVLTYFRAALGASEIILFRRKKRVSKNGRRAVIYNDNWGYLRGKTHSLRKKTRSDDES